jgi:hypothetical protein
MLNGAMGSPVTFAAVATLPSGNGARVTVGNDFFTPAEVTIGAGETVTWTWASDAESHSVRSPRQRCGLANELVDWFNAVDPTCRTELLDLNELDFARFDAHLKQRLAELRAELRQELAELRTDLLRLMFGFRITSLLALAGLLLALRGH